MLFTQEELQEYSLHLVMKELPTLSDQQLSEVHTEIESILNYRLERER